MSSRLNFNPSPNSITAPEFLTRLSTSPPKAKRICISPISDDTTISKVEDAANKMVQDLPSFIPQFRPTKGYHINSPLSRRFRPLPKERIHFPSEMDDDNEVYTPLSISKKPFSNEALSSMDDDNEAYALPTRPKKGPISRTFPNLNPNSPGTSNSVASPVFSFESTSKNEFEAFLRPKFLEGLTSIGHGDYHDVYTKQIGGVTRIIKTMRHTKPNLGTYSDQEKISVIQSTITAYDKDKNLGSPYFKMAEMINRDEVLKDGYYIYEYIVGKKAAFKDVKEYLSFLVQDPKKYYMPDFKPDNVIVPEKYYMPDFKPDNVIVPDECLPVIIDPSHDDTNWEEANYGDLLEESFDRSDWDTRAIELGIQLRKWYANDENINLLFEEFDQLPFGITGTKIFWEMVKTKINFKIQSNKELAKKAITPRPIPRSTSTSTPRPSSVNKTLSD